MMGKWAGSKSEWIEGLWWEKKDEIDRSVLGYHGILLYPKYVGK